MNYANVIRDQFDNGPNRDVSSGWASVADFRGAAMPGVV